MGEEELRQGWVMTVVIGAIGMLVGGQVGLGLLGIAAIGWVVSLIALAMGWRGEHRDG